MKIFLCSLWLLSAFALAEEPKAESNNDIRGHIVLYKLEWKSKKETFILERTNGQEYQLRHESGKNQKIVKADRREAEKIDSDLTLLFVDLQLENDFKLTCDPVIQITLRGDQAYLCPHNEKKTQELKSIWERHQGMLK
jgi:hypothetical protein